MVWAEKGSIGNGQAWEVEPMLAKVERNKPPYEPGSGHSKFHLPWEFGMLIRPEDPTGIQTQIRDLLDALGRSGIHSGCAELDLLLYEPAGDDGDPLGAPESGEILKLVKRRVAEHCSCPIESGIALAETARQMPKFRPIGCPGIDKLLGGGLACQEITELAGPPNTGKTQVTNYAAQARPNRDAPGHDHKPALGATWGQFPSKTLLLTRPPEGYESFLLKRQNGEQIHTKQVKAEVFRSVSAPKAGSIAVFYYGKEDIVSFEDDCLLQMQ
ncbi:hypothetical protein HDU67_009181 [Dinochytrium kinnereticum]|nr:hypothetical protein HDU67_009181 [Dinochytrium kinnereticum]